MKKINIFLVLLMCTSILLGCDSSGDERRLDYNFKQGYGGLNIRLLENAPPEKVFPYSDFKIIIEVDNQGAYDITNGYVTILGLDEKYFQIYPSEQSFDDLLGKSLTSPAGDKRFVEFDGSSGELFQGAEEYVGNYFLKVSYDSEFEFVDTVCINPNLYAVYDAGCEVKDKRYSGQGAPVAIIEVEEIISPGRSAEFRLLLENKGKGDLKKVFLTEARLGADELDCEFKNAGADKKQMNFTSDNKQAGIVCRKNFIGGQGSFTTSLLIRFKYEYESIEKNKLLLVK